MSDDPKTAEQINGPSDLPSVAGRMEMTHADFQRACQVAISDFQQEPNCQSYLVGLFCEAVRCSRECCEIATARVSNHHSRIFELETTVSNLRRDLQKVMDQNRKLRAALEKWKAYCSDESTEPSIANEETGEAFFDAYFEMMEALKP